MCVLCFCMRFYFQYARKLLKITNKRIKAHNETQRKLYSRAFKHRPTKEVKVDDGEDQKDEQKETTDVNMEVDAKVADAKVDDDVQIDDVTVEQPVVKESTDDTVMVDKERTDDVCEEDIKNSVDSQIVQESEENDVPVVDA